MNYRINDVYFPIPHILGENAKLRHSSWLFRANETSFHTVDEIIIIEGGG